MEGLPFLPGNTFKDPTQNKYHVSQTLGYKNGFTTHRRPVVGIGGQPLCHNQLSEADLDHLANFNPTLTYGQAKQTPPEDFIPAHVAWDKKNDRGDNWHWKDMNIGTTITFYGRSIQITSCDKFTSDFLESEGIVVNPAQDMSADPYIEDRKKSLPLTTYTTPSTFDKMKQFLELDRRVLRFYCIWDDRPNLFGDLRSFVLHYYLVDDTLEVRERYKRNDGRDPFPVLIGRHKIPKDYTKLPSSFPTVAMETSEEEVEEYVTPKDLMVGKTVNLYQRRFLIYDCDNFTKAFYYHNFGVTDFPKVDVQLPKEEPEKMLRGDVVHGAEDQLPKVDHEKMEIPPYNSYGFLEDSVQSSLQLIQQPPHKDLVKLMENNLKILRFEAKLDSVRPEDACRRFIMSYRLSDDKLTIYEPPLRNSGFLGGKFLEATRVAKPNSTANNPEYYGPQDFFIGAVIDVFSHRFVITNADAFVVDFMQQHQSQFPPATVSSLKDHLQQAGAVTQRGRGGGVTVTRSPGELEQLVRQVRAQLKKIAITDKLRVDRMFLRYGRDHVGYISVDDLRELCRSLHLPLDDDVVMSLARQCSSNEDGHISLEEFRRFVESP